MKWVLGTEKNIKATKKRFTVSKTDFFRNINSGKNGKGGTPGCLRR